MYIEAAPLNYHVYDIKSAPDLFENLSHDSIIDNYTRKVYKYKSLIGT